jgi:hypothetical protein
LTQEQVSEWAELYPGMDILRECRKALAWVKASPQNRKTADGMPRFFVNWFNRDANQGHRSKPNHGNTPVLDDKYDGVTLGDDDVERRH